MAIDLKNIKHKYCCLIWQWLLRKISDNPTQQKVIQRFKDTTYLDAKFTQKYNEWQSNMHSNEGKHIIKQSGEVKVKDKIKNKANYNKNNKTKVIDQ